MALRGWSGLFKIAVIALVVVTIITPFSGINRVEGQDTRFPAEKIDSYIRQEIAKTHLPGIAVAIVSGEEIVYLKGFGYASLKTRSPVIPQTIFDLASCSKSLTAFAVLTLWQDGLIELDNPVVFYLPEFCLDDDEFTSQITVRHLLLQTSGLPGDIAEPVSYHSGYDAMDALVTAMSGIHLQQPPGTTFEYANLNYNLLGALVEKVSGKQFEDYIQERVFTPLNMRNSTLRPEIASRRHRADGHQLLLGKVVVRNTPIYRSAIPAGWIMSSAEDMGRWIQVNLNNGIIDGKHLISGELIELLHTPGVKFTKDDEEISYGMGWFIGTTGNGEPVLWHGGDTPNFLSQMVLVPEKKFGIVMLANGQTCEDAHEIAINIVNLALGVDFELPSAPWWASWKSVDNIAIYATILSLFLLLGIIPYAIWQIRIMKNSRRQVSNDDYGGKKVEFHWIVLPTTPWMMIAVILTLTYIVIQALFGFNVFSTIFRFGDFAPPGVLVAAITMLVTFFLWAITLSVTTIFGALTKARR